jgi:hypothetical protein
VLLFVPARPSHTTCTCRASESREGKRTEYCAWDSGGKKFVPAGKKFVVTNWFSQTFFEIVLGRMLHEAQVVVVGADDSETSFAFDALVENEEGQICTQ